MKKKKSTTEKTDQFLAGLGTSGGAIGSPDLVNFGGGDIQSQLLSGNSDNYAASRMKEGDTRIGVSSPMPQDLDASYVKLNLPGSPLPLNALLASQNIIGAQRTQGMIMTEEQMFLAEYLPAAGLSQLPVGQPPLQSKKEV
jgi:hypothetical protein|tara:strand:+ start:134 stop:556 length:423 start_codon:yes stop_codon:yes gene_type:complete